MKFSTLDQWLDWQASLNPREIELGLDRVGRVWEALGTPLHTAVITVGGTNGKGSCVALLEAILGAAGYRTGSYTSPHLRRYNERIRLDGEPVSDALICNAFERIEAARGDTLLTYFEFGTLAALLILADAGVDAAILEVGLGGRLDAVNLVDADVALLTNVGLDHQDWLGSDREMIGREKAGIFRPGRVAVYGDEDPPGSVTETADSLGSRLRIRGRDFDFSRQGAEWSWHSGAKERGVLPLPRLRGEHQLINAAAVLTALDALAERLPVDQRAVREGLLSAGVAGRMEVRPGTPTWVLDVAHNPPAARCFADALRELPLNGRRFGVLGMLGDKDAAGVVAALDGLIDEWHLVSLADESRGLSAEALAQRLALPGVSCHGSVRQGLSAVAAKAGPADQIVVLGSFHTVGQALSWLEIDI